MLEIIISSIILIALIIASSTDIKTREVPDWLNFSLVPLGLGIRLIYSLIIGESSFFIAGLMGFGVFFIIGLIMFYTGQWGGGDSKMLMGLGALIGIPFEHLSYANFMSMPLLSFLINTTIVGSFYGLIWSFFKILKNKKNFKKELKKLSNSIVQIRKFMLILFVIFIIIILIIPDILTKIFLISLVMIIYSSFYLIIFVKAVEKSCMLKYINPKEVTEGDWIAKDIVIDGKRISGPKDLGIERTQLKKLISYYNKGKIKKVLIKVGIPFVPSFLMAYILTLYLGNLLLLVV
jgi:Flp pilus assembly protein protease CpaA